MRRKRKSLSTTPILKDLKSRQLSSKKKKWFLNKVPPKLRKKVRIVEKVQGSKAVKKVVTLKVYLKIFKSI